MPDARPERSSFRALRTAPWRGDQVAAGVVVLATLVLLVDLRFADAWGDVPRFLLTALAAAFVGALAGFSPPQYDEPRPYQTVLYVGTCLLALLALAQLALVLGAHRVTSPGTVVWVMLGTGLLALAFARGRNAAYCTLVAGVACTAALVAAVQWLFAPQGASGTRWVLVGAILVELLLVAALRDRHRRHAVMVVDVAGLTALFLASTFASLSLLGASSRPSAWWTFVLVAVGFALVAYAGVDREPGPGYLGVAILVAFAVLEGTTGDATLLGWPVVLAAVALAFLVLGLRPSTPLPPPPGEGEREGPRAVPLPRREDLPVAGAQRARGDDEL